MNSIIRNQCDNVTENTPQQDFSRSLELATTNNDLCALYGKLYTLIVLHC